MGLALVTALAAAVAVVSPVSAAKSPQIPLDAETIPQFAHPLPLLNIGGDGTSGIATFGGIGPTEIHICEFDAKVLPPGTPGVTANTRSWGYVYGTTCPASADPTYTRDSFIGPVLVAIRNMGTQLKVVNDLPNARDTGVLAYKYSVDQTVHWADPLNDEVGDCIMRRRWERFHLPEVTARRTMRRSPHRLTRLFRPLFTCMAPSFRRNWTAVRMPG